MSAAPPPDSADAARSALAELRAGLGSPLVVQLVDAVPAPGTRPVLAASLVRASGLPSVVVAVVADGKPGVVAVDGITVVTVPVGTAYRDLAKASALDASRLTGWIEARDRALGLSKKAAEGDTISRARWTSARRSLVGQGAVPARITAADPPSGRWVKGPAAADLELAVATALDSLVPAVVHAYGTTVPAALRATRFGRLRGEEVHLVLDVVPPLPTADQLAAADGTVVPLPFLACPPTTDAVVFAGPPDTAELPAVTRSRIALAPHEPLVAVRWTPGRPDAVAAVVDALAALDELHVLVYASRSGPALTALLADAQRRGLRGRLHTSTETGQATLQGADATVLLATGDTVPVDLLDSVSLGIPVVTASAPTLDALIGAHGFGRSHDGTAQDFLAALRDVLGDARYRDAASVCASTAPPWSEQRTALISLYAGLLPAGSQAPEPLAAVSDEPVVEVSESDDHEDVVAPAVVPDADVRLGIGPANYAGQATAWARAGREQRGLHATSFGYVNKFLFDFDHPRRAVVEGDNAAGAAQTAWLLDTYTHLLLDGFLPATGGFVPGGTAGEAEFLRRHGRTVGLICHGTEIRDPDRHMARLPQSYYARAPRDWVARVRGSVHANTASLARLELPVFVSTPDLLLDVPTASWLPVVVDVDLFAEAGPALERRVPRVLHAPSRSVPPIKGTEIIEPALRALHEQGLIEYVAAENLPHDQMRDLVASVDIVVDQILSGFYGVAAVEAMAAGRVVVGFVADDVRALMEEAPPVVDVRDADVASTVLEVLSDRDRFAALAATGPGFARRWHDGRVSADVLAGF